MKACKATYHDATIIFSSIEDALESMKYDLEGTEPGEPVDVTLEVVEMTQEEYEALPEFDGF